MKEFLRPGSIPVYRSIAGDGQAPDIEAYPFQGLDVQVEPYGRKWAWLETAKTDAILARDLDGHGPAWPAGDWKYRGHIKPVTPLGTSTATLAREGHDMLAAPCGYCGQVMGKHRCDMEGAG